MKIQVVADWMLKSKESIQFRKPKSKKKRIRRKYFKNKKNFKVIEVEKFIYDTHKDICYVTQGAFDKLN